MYVLINKVCFRFRVSFATDSMLVQIDLMLCLYFAVEASDDFFFVDQRSI